MASLNDLVRRHTDLAEADLEWLHLLVSDWELVADLSFADLVLWLPDRDGRRYHAGAQMRPTTGPTAFTEDLVGTVVRRGARPLIDRAFDEGRICREGDPEWRHDVPVRLETIPVRRARSVIAVIARSTNLLTARTPSRLELTYLETAGDLAQMIAQGQFPHAVERAYLDSSPRVGDGMVRLDEQGFVTYASPNGLSAYRRFGLAADLVGGHLGTVTAKLARSDAPTDEAIEVLASGRKPRETEVENDTATIRLRLLPLSPGGARTGALVLLRDVTELRRRERELLTKDATIREIHHRVKNNLQTVAALLRLQARRLDAPAGRAALEEAVRRVGSIAVVHETLAHTQDEAVAFDNVADRVMAMATEVSTAEGGVRPRRRGRFGMLPAEVATPLAMVLTEVLQNALEHGLKDGPGELTVSVERLVGRLRVVVADTGVGLPDDFDADRSGRLGLQIVRTLVTVELTGTLDIGPQPGGGTRVIIDIPLPGPQVATPRR